MTGCLFFSKALNYYGVYGFAEVGFDTVLPITASVRKNNEYDDLCSGKLFNTYVNVCYPHPIAWQLHNFS